jgi:hypothetical protein
MTPALRKQWRACLFYVQEKATPALPAAAVGVAPLDHIFAPARRSCFAATAVGVAPLGIDLVVPDLLPKVLMPEAMTRRNAPILIELVAMQTTGADRTGTLIINF